MYVCVCVRAIVRAHMHSPQYSSVAVRKGEDEGESARLMCVLGDFRLLLYQKKWDGIRNNQPPFGCR